MSKLSGKSITEECKKHDIPTNKLDWGNYTQAVGTLPDGKKTQVIYPSDRPLSFDTESAVREWFLRLGIVIILLLILIFIL